MQIGLRPTEFRRRGRVVPLLYQRAKTSAAYCISHRTLKNTSKNTLLREHRRPGRRLQIPRDPRRILGLAVGSTFGQPAAPFCGQQLHVILGTRVPHFWIWVWSHFRPAGCSSFGPPGGSVFAGCLVPFWRQAGFQFMALLVSSKRSKAGGASNLKNFGGSLFVMQIQL